MNWYAVYTKPKHEDLVSRRLADAGFSVYNPRLRHAKYVKGGLQECVEQLFPCYVFVRFDPARHAWMIAYTRGVRKIIGGPEIPWAIPDGVLDCIRAHEEDGATVIRPRMLQAGERIRITDGPLSGLSGVFEKYIAGSDRALLLLTAIEYQARVVVHSAMFAKAS